MHRKLDLRKKKLGGGHDHVATVNFTREEGVGTGEKKTFPYHLQYHYMNRERPLV